MTQIQGEDGRGEELLHQFVTANRPVVAILGQTVGYSTGAPDPVLGMAIEKAGKSGSSWSDLLGRESLPESFYTWLGERFTRRTPSASLVINSEFRFSAVFTSSIDPGIGNIFASGGREPELVLLGTPTPRALRSIRRPPIYYLFGRASAGIPDMQPPLSVRGLATRRLRHTGAMLRNLDETATMLGLIVIDGYSPGMDWLRPEEILTGLCSAPKSGVLWCGDEPSFSGEDAALYNELRENGIIIRDERGLSQILTYVNNTFSSSEADSWNEPEVVSLSDGKKLITSAKLRLHTQASASIVDDSWMGFLAPYSPDEESLYFHNFHGIIGGARAVFEGVRRHYAIVRDFEPGLWSRTERALGQHHTQQGAIIVHGQSGVGKSISIARLALRAREHGAAVLMAQGRVPQPGDLSEFLQAVDKAGGVTLLIVDATASPQRYDDLLRALRSGGHKVVVVGTSYKIEQIGAMQGRLFEASSTLSKEEQSSLSVLITNFAPDADLNNASEAPSEHALANFYWSLPLSRGRISDGLGREATVVERELRTRGAKPKPIRALGTLGQLLVAEGLKHPESPTISEVGDFDISSDSPAGKLIDYVMAASRLYKSIPLSLVFRAITVDRGYVGHGIDLDLVMELFEGQDLFRWKQADDECSEYLIGARLQIEAEIVCNRRLGGADAEAAALIHLIHCATRAGPDNSEETFFVAEIAHALGPDGPAGNRYSNSYADVGRALTTLRGVTGVSNGRLMLQESALRRAYVRTHNDILPDEKEKLLEEATVVVDSALQIIEQKGAKGIFASRRTREHLWVERAATYGFLATDSAQRDKSGNAVWSSYKAAREAVRIATGRVDSYVPLDIALWMPARILRETNALNEVQTIEIQADLRATLDLIDTSVLDSTHYDQYQRQRLILAEVLDDSDLADDAFDALIAAGSTAGYYIRAKALAPLKLEGDDEVSDSVVRQAQAASGYLRNVYSDISSDIRCLQLLLAMEWLVFTRRWIFKGTRQPLPTREVQRLAIKDILLDMAAIGVNQMQPRFRYLEAVMTWLSNNERASAEAWRRLANETEFVEAGRVTNRHVLTDEAFQPKIFSGIVERRIGPERWSVRVEGLGQCVDLTENYFPGLELAVGKVVRDFSIVFNYRGTLADPYPARLRPR
ncbi:ATP-binding protein [Pseudomonas abieticivorans]|uniref:ATP-binding protein n=1 Tax=Pseudomonas abieticivorans TaxID=2931382 RepID=UPI0020C0AD0E|nr:ATP-binding protein [Pseudomonas sp. PIA16]